MFNPGERSQPIASCAFLFVVCWLLCGTASAAPSITLSKKSGPPTSRFLVSGRGFEPNAGVDIFFDTKDRALVVTNGNGEFHDAGIEAPRSARPGKHWVTVLERNNDKGAQKSFLVQTDWSQFHFDADGTRTNPYENVLNVNNVASLGLKWSYATGSYVSDPTAVNGVIYSASNDGNVYALNARTGTKLWSYAMGGSPGSSPAVTNGVVFASDFVDPNGGNLFALDAHTGAVLWSGDAGQSSPAVANGVVYVGDPGGMEAVNANTGAGLWGYYTSSYVSSAPTVVNGVVYFAYGYEDYHVYALNASTGARLWTYLTGGGFSSPTVANGVVYVGSDYPDNKVYALNAQTGAPLWSYAAGGTGSLDSSPAVANGVVYVGSDDGIVYALNASTGALLWSYATGGYVSSSPAVANGVVYFGAYPDSVYALNASTGALLWSYATGGYVSDPIVANGVVYVGSTDGNLYAFGLIGGSQIKEQAASNRRDLKRLHPDFNLKVSKLSHN
jgi:outer membrane protein assembly factor BamB